MTTGIAIIGGTGFGSGLAINRSREDVLSATYNSLSRGYLLDHKFPITRYYPDKIGLPSEIVFVNRHAVLLNCAFFPSPENVATETLMIGLYQEGIRRGIEYNIISTSAVGISDTSLGPGTIGIPDDFVDRVNYSPSFEIDGFKPDYVSMHPSFDPKLREIMLQAAEIENVRVVNGGIYVRRLKGRRYETAEEVEEEMMLHPNKLLYFGMTSPEEDIAANALGMKYATIVFATNNGAGLDAPISHENVAKEFEKALPRGIRIINRASELLH